MPDSISLNDRLIAPHGPLTGAPARRTDPKTSGAPAFADLLKQAQSADKPGPLKFSAHAQTRIQSRQIQLGAEEMQRIDTAVQKVAGKGSRESLILLDQTALVVSVPNRTVITVVDKENLKQNVFTNIDSAVIA